MCHICSPNLVIIQNLTLLRNKCLAEIAERVSALAPVWSVTSVKNKIRDDALNLETEYLQCLVNFQNAKCSANCIILHAVPNPISSF